MGDETLFDLVISGGRVMNPESESDGLRNLGISGGRIQAISEGALRGRDAIDASGLIVTAGFIDLHSHGQDEENYAIQAQDGVTTALELELGAADVDRWYSEREGTAAINYGASAGHIPVRMGVMRDPGELLPMADAASRAATEEELAELGRRLKAGLDQGALAVGFGIQYTPAATRWEILEAFRLAAEYGATCHVHMRGMGHVDPLGSVEGMEELIAATAVTGALGPRSPHLQQRPPCHATAAADDRGGPGARNRRDHRVLPVPRRVD